VCDAECREYRRVLQLVFARLSQYHTDTGRGLIDAHWAELSSEDAHWADIFFQKEIIVGL
jgi:hypothetical protein